MKKGRFIVIDGADGSGKATQARLLATRLKREGKNVLAIDFPGYYRNLFGKLIGECLAGKHGDFLKTDPYIVSVLYAADRWESAKVIQQHLDCGGTVVADRYASSNQMHQGSKIIDARRRQKFLLWLDEMEFKVLKIPRPDMVVYLDVPVEISQKLLRQGKLNKKKRYLKGRADAAESDVEHLSKSIKMATKIVGRTNTWRRVECVRDGEILSRDEIHKRIYDTIKKVI